MFSLKEEEEADPNAQRGHTADDLCLSATHPSVLIFPTGYIPTHSPTPPTSTLRATRAHDADLLIYPFTVPPWARHRDSRGYFCIQCIKLIIIGKIRLVDLRGPLVSDASQLLIIISLQPIRQVTG